MVVHGVGRQRPGETAAALGRSLIGSPAARTLSGRLVGRRVPAEGQAPDAEAETLLALEARGARGALTIRLYEAYWGDVATGYAPWDLVAYRLWLLCTLAFPVVNLLGRRYRPRPLGIAAFAGSFLALAATGVAAHLSDLALRVALRVLGLRRTEQRIDRVILEYAGDIYRYLRGDGRPRFLERFRSAFARAASENDEIQVLGHSLGSVVAYDALTGGLLDPADVARLAVLHTWGSPLDKFYFVWPGRMRFALDPLPPRPVRWINWAHRWDPIGGRLDFFAPVPGLVPPENRVYSGPGSFAAAHNGYWTNPEVVGSLLRALGLQAPSA